MPAVPSTTYRALFAEPVAAFEMTEPGDPSALLPTEGDFSSRAAGTRVREFAAGRFCARRALAEFDIENFPLRAADDRQPLWPPSLLGSITHTAGFVAAVAARRSELTGIGIDTEVLTAVRTGVAARICLPVELDWVHSLPEAERMAATLLIFSAKEAFYKSQYPLTREELGFEDVRITIGAAGCDSPVFTGLPAMFMVEPQRPLAIAARAALPARGAYCFHGRFVSTGIAFPANRSPPQ